MVPLASNIIKNYLDSVPFKPLCVLVYYPRSSLQFQFCEELLNDKLQRSAGPPAGSRIHFGTKNIGFGSKQLYWQQHNLGMNKLSYLPE
jgi:hypothetical protein